ncbi:hypothetical protein ACF0H5_018338 [Mactra antiquata]
MRPTSMEDALDKIKWAIHTCGIIVGDTKSDSKSSTNKDKVKIAAIFKPDYKARIEKLEKWVDRIDNKLDLVIDQLTKLVKSNTREMSKSSSRTRNTEEIVCFVCQKFGHYAPDCPH